MNNVIDFPQTPTPNRQCPKCGSEWWVVAAVVIDTEDESVVAYAGEPKCYDCGVDSVVELRSVDD